MGRCMQRSRVHRSARIALPLALALAALGACAKRTPGASLAPSAAASAPRSAEQALAAKLDALMLDEQKKLGVEATPLVGDETFLRRVTLDLVGRLPSEAEVLAFSSSAQPDKRRKKVDELLASAERPRSLARVFEPLLLGPSLKKDARVDRGAMLRWLEARFAVRDGYDAVVRDLLTAEGKSSLGGPRRESIAGGPERAREEREAGVNGAVSYFLRFGGAPSDLAGTTSRLFLGVQLQCAQCHDHKTEAWKQADFRSFGAAFANLRVRPVAREKGELPVLDLEEGPRPSPQFKRAPGGEALAEAPPRSLDGKPLDERARRTSLAAWMTSRENPYFSRAIVNRVWAELVGEGFVEPIDDFRPSNPARVGAALDTLAEGFEASGHSLDFLVRVITATNAYQRQVGKGARGVGEDAFARRALIEPSSEQLLGAIVSATGLEASLDRVLGDQKPLALEEVRRELSFTWGSDDEATSAAYDGSVEEALLLLHGRLTAAGSSLSDAGTLSEVLTSKTTRERIERLYLRILSRKPTPDEAALWLTYVGEARPLDRPRPVRSQLLRGSGLPRAFFSQADTAEEQALEDLAWTLLNTSEFFFK